MFGPDRKRPIPFHDDRVILYKKAVVDATFPADFFRFRPPVDAALVAKFDDGMPDFDKLRTDLIGKPAPATELKAEDGKSFTLASLKGKPVLLDLWATWCAPCVEAIPELKKLNAELKPTSLQWFSVDINDDPKVVGELLKKEKISWTNLHDSSGLLLQSFHTPGIPSAILIDADGKVLYIGGELKDLRSAIAKLGTEYAPIASATAEPSAKTP
jgi:thiol-disulfide isomerase/thioredoxin